jgi:uncharacterized damage-inducible protein DinB
MRLIAALALLAVPVLYAQAPANPLSSDAKAAWNGVKNNIVRSAEKMPEENYSFRPVPDVRTFGELIGHITDANYLICGAERGEKHESAAEKMKKTKDELVGALKESIGFCDAAFDAITDARAGEMVKLFGRDRARLSALHLNIAHDNEHYGNLVTYLRIKGLVPPSSERRQ